MGTSGPLVCPCFGPEFVGPSLLTLKQRTAFALPRILVCLLLQKMRCVPHSGLNCGTSLSLRRTPLPGHACNFSGAPRPPHARRRSTDGWCAARGKAATLSACFREDTILALEHVLCFGHRGRSITSHVQNRHSPVRLQTVPVDPVCSTWGMVVFSLSCMVPLVRTPLIVTSRQHPTPREYA